MRTQRGHTALRFAVAVAFVVGPMAVAFAPDAAARPQTHALTRPSEPESAAGEPGQPGLAILTAKALICSLDGQQVQDNAVVFVKDGKIEQVLPRAAAAIPADYEVLDVGASWVMPGMLDLHSHVGGTFDINDAVYLANPGLRAKTAVVPGNAMLEMALASGVTSILFIPGSATNVGGQGILIKTGPKRYDDAVLRDPGSIKVAQWGNPERWAIGVGKTFENYTIREIFTRGRAYAERWRAHEEDGAPRPAVDPQLEIFRYVFSHRIQASVHTQVFQVVLATITILKGEFGIDVFIDHGEFHGFMTAELSQRMGVNTILGPRNVDMPSRGIINWVGSNPERMEGIAAAYQSRGQTRIGFNTDAPVIPQEELFLQAAMAVRHGFEDDHLDTVRGLTIVPAVTIGLGHRIGSLERGKDADLLVITGHPADPRSHVQLAFIDGQRLYDPSRQETRRW